MEADDNVSRVIDDTTINVEAQGPVKFSVWVSFAEIYNETIYDLLEPCPMGKGRKRTTLRLGDDTNGNPYIKGDEWILNSHLVLISNNIIILINFLALRTKSYIYSFTCTSSLISPVIVNFFQD